MTVAVSPNPVHAGQLVDIAWTVSGPVDLTTSCAAPNPMIWAVSPSHQRLAITQPCLGLSGSGYTVLSGRVGGGTEYWNTTRLPAGFYSIHGRLTPLPVHLFSDENLPVVVVQVLPAS
jgi:hypothetical protein